MNKCNTLTAETQAQPSCRWFDYIDFASAHSCSPRAKAVLHSLARHADNNGVSFPHIKTIASETGYSDRTIQRGLRELKETGVVTVELKRNRRGKNIGNIYTINHPALQETETMERSSNVIRLQPVSTQSVSPSPRHSVTTSGDKLSPSTINYQLTKERKRSVGVTQAVTPARTTRQVSLFEGLEEEQQPKRRATRRKRLDCDYDQHFNRWWRTYSYRYIGQKEPAEAQYLQAVEHVKDHYSTDNEAFAHELLILVARALRGKKSVDDSYRIPSADMFFQNEVWRTAAEEDDEIYCKLIELCREHGIETEEVSVIISNTKTSKPMVIAWDEDHGYEEGE